MKRPDPGAPAQRWRLYRAFNGVDGGGAFRQRLRSRLALERCTLLTAFGVKQRG
jgi:hypothetical protein